MRGIGTLGIALAASVAASLAVAGGASARTFEVNRVADPVPDGCTRAECTLREAILAANARPGADEVVVRSGRRYQLQVTGGGEDLGATGDLDVTDLLVLRADARRRAAIDANGLDRVLDLRARTTLSRLTITGGLLASMGGRGAGVSATGAPVRIVRSAIRGNVADGSGVAAGGLYALDGGAVVRSSISGNSATGNSGGLWVAGELDSPFTMDRVRIVGNEAIGSFPGGGLITEANVTRARIANNRAATGCGGIGAGSDFPFGEGVRLVRSVIEGNEAASNGGGGLCTSGVGSDVALIRSVVRRNEAGFGGGLDISYGSGLISRSVIENNTATGHGGGIFAAVAQPLEIRGSTIADNVAGMNGGGIHTESASEVNITSSTIANNRADVDGGGIHAINPMGGNATLVTLMFTTIARNVADADGNVSGAGGGIANGLDASYLARGALLGRNSGVGDDDDCYATVDSQGRNLISVVGGGCMGQFDHPTDLVGNPGIGQLGRNGGPTKTVPLKRGSRAVDAGGRDCPARDQRGVRRPQGRRCDIGSFEHDEG